MDLIYSVWVSVGLIVFFFGMPFSVSIIDWRFQQLEYECRCYDSGMFLELSCGNAQIVNKKMHELHQAYMIPICFSTTLLMFRM